MILDRYKISQAAREKAEAAAFGEDFQGTITGKRGRLIGALGEELCLGIFPEATRVNNYDYDLLLDGSRIDVKTIEFSVDPKHYKQMIGLSVNRAEQRIAPCDYYFFCGISKDLSYGLVYGFMYYRDFYESCIHKKIGDSKAGGGVFKAECWQAWVPHLNPINSFLKRYK